MDYLAELPWWMPVGIVVVGVSLCLAGNNRLDRRLTACGAVLLVAALGLGLAAYFLESDRERAVAATRALVKAVVRRDRPAIGALLDTRATALGIEGRDAIAAVAAASAEAADLRGAVITGIRGHRDDGRIIVLFRVLASFRDGSQLSDWRLSWVRVAGAILMERAEFLGGPGMGDADIRRYLKDNRPR